MLLLFICSLLIISLGQPASIGALSPIAAILGFGLFFFSIADSSAKRRFWIGTLFYTLVSIIQLRWFFSHPYIYIIAVIIGIALFLGLQFGAVCLLASRKQQVIGRALFTIPAMWTLFEWSRLYVLSGYTFNPVGLALAWNTATLQCAQFFGIFGLSFLVMLTNVFFSRVLLVRHNRSSRAWYMWIAASLLPFVIGYSLLRYHSNKMKEYDTDHLPIKALIVDFQRLPDEIADPSRSTRKNPLTEAKKIWEEVLRVVLSFKRTEVDLIILPEIAISLPSRAPLFSNTFVTELFGSTGKEAFDEYIHSSQDIARRLSTHFNTTVAIGLEGDIYDPVRKKTFSTNSALLFTGSDNATYSKQVLVPIGEYIPFDWAKPLAEEYGLYDSWMQGVGPVHFRFSKGIISPSICYEETFADVIRKNAKGASLLINLTNDGWYPESSLAQQHLEHARPRTCENGMPLIRSCNFGVSCAIDSLGRTTLAVPSSKGVHCALASVSGYTYKTLYHLFGDVPIIMISLLLLLIGTARRKAS